MVGQEWDGRSRRRRRRVLAGAPEGLVIVLPATIDDRQTDRDRWTLPHVF
jgi:hypothetical protein